MENGELKNHGENGDGKINGRLERLLAERNIRLKMGGDVTSAIDEIAAMSNEQINEEIARLEKEI